jgi:hypothetical protein
VIESESQVVTFAAGGLLVLAVIGGILILARLWMREALRVVPGDVLEERTIDPSVPEDRPSPGWRRGLRRPTATGPPTDAAAAYVTLMRDLAARPMVARAAGESPAEHARRLRSAGIGKPGLDLLAADYELARYAGRPITAGETRRAIARWQRLRRQLGV